MNIIINKLFSLKENLHQLRVIQKKGKFFIEGKVIGDKEDDYTLKFIQKEKDSYLDKVKGVYFSIILEKTNKVSGEVSSEESNFDLLDEAVAYLDDFVDFSSKIRTHLLYVDANLLSKSKEQFDLINKLITNRNLDDYELIYKNIRYIYFTLLGKEESVMIEIGKAHSRYQVFHSPHNVNYYLDEVINKGDLDSMIAYYVQEMSKVVENEQKGFVTISKKELQRYKELESFMEKLQKANDDMFDTLTFYAVKENYEDIPIHGKVYNSILRDKGKQANDVLASLADTLN